VTRSADPSRLVTYCSYHYLWDRGFPYVDVISINEYFGWELASLPLLAGMLDKVHRAWPEKPVIVSEVGAQAGFGIHNFEPQLAGILTSMLSKDLSEEHQALYIGSHLDTIWAKRSYVNGVVVWAYADYFCRMNKARTTTMPAGINACGIVTTDRKRKQSYTTVKERFGMIHANSVTACNDHDNQLHGAR
jgi:beta-glucuronidase